MSKFIFEGTEYERFNTETVLDTLLRNKLNIPHSCKGGICQSCMMRATNGKIPIEAQVGLKETLLAQDYFLPCCCQPDGELVIESVHDAEIYGRGIIVSKALLSSGVCRIGLKPANDLYYRAGQFINLRRRDGLVRSYSLASVPKLDDTLELHVKRMENGQMSNWLLDDVQIGTELDIQGPNGRCYYLPGNPGQPLLLIGTGTGLAPLIGIIRDALMSGHQGDIYLYHGSRKPDGLYLQNDLHIMSERHHNFHYTPSLSGRDVPTGCIRGRADDIALARHTRLNGFAVYLCGDPLMVNSSKRLAYLAGASIEDIHADPYEMKDLRKVNRDMLSSASCA
ncbi:MAG: FAD-binding oxidoreductase [Gammaproteobacteria bacterium]|nr:MAG: FAD-binding oxidoreductase [Gammaproteobacteria bacterium]